MTSYVWNDELQSGQGLDANRRQCTDDLGVAQLRTLRDNAQDSFDLTEVRNEVLHDLLGADLEFGIAYTSW